MDTLNTSPYSKITDLVQYAKEMGEIICASGMFGVTKPEQGAVVAMFCVGENISLGEFMRTYHIVDGKVTMRADSMMGRFFEKGGEVKWVRRDNEAVEGIFSFGTNRDITVKCSLQDVRENGVAIGKDGRSLKLNWQKFPRQMLTARVVSEAIRLLAPQLISGVYTPEEVSDFTSTSTPIPARVQVSAELAGEDNKSAKDILVSRLENLLEKYEPKASEYLISKNLIKQGQTYRDLDSMSANRLLTNPEKLIDIISK